MSAFVCNPKHFAALINFASRRPGSSYHFNGRTNYFAGQETRLGQILTDENVRSVNFRYRQHQAQPAPTYHHTFGTQVNLLDVLKGCDCYDYQACETDDYYQTEACAIIQSIRKAAIASLPGWSEAQWEIQHNS